MEDMIFSVNYAINWLHYFGNVTWPKSQFPQLQHEDNNSACLIGLLQVWNRKEYVCVYVYRSVCPCMCVCNVSAMSGTCKPSIITVVIVVWVEEERLCLNAFPKAIWHLCFSCFTPSFNKFSSCAHSVVDMVLGARDPAVNKIDKVPGFSTKAVSGSFILLSSWVFWLHSLSGQPLDVKSAKSPTWPCIGPFQGLYIIAKSFTRVWE